MNSPIKPPKSTFSKESTWQRLRVRAEASFRKKTDATLPNSLPPETTEALLHELQVHQIELEMQNEELRESQVALDIVRARYFDLYDLAPIGYLTLNAYGAIQQANLTVANLLGMTRGALIKQPLSKLILKADQDIYYLSHKKLMESGDTQSFDLQIVRSDFSVFWANLVVTLADAYSHDNEDSLTTEQEIRVVLSDISARKKAEFALQEARLIADKANLAKSEFLSSMSHELRTPLNAILGFAQLIEAAEPPPTIKQQKNVEQILKAGWYLLELINEILDLAVIEAGKVVLHLEHLSLAEVLNDAEAMLEHQAQQRGIHMQFPLASELYFVQADRVRIKQVMVNLLSNALKYNKPNGSVLVSYVKKSSERVRICVQDTGEGLTTDNMAQLFQPFNRLGKESSKEEGTGIGLVVAKRIVELMSGAIGVESVVGKGTVFWVEFDLAESV
ncbi:MAG: PAS domain-containing sensor histidine kinase [Bdellovibrio sp.]|nr:PAS domain-containing sensor histidine kinase [Methylotenera sp.]